MADQWLRCTTPDIAGCEQAAELFVIGHDTVTVDGDLEEWVDVDWIALDEVYYGSPNDIGSTLEDAKFALKWNSDTDKIYAAVIVDDANHVLFDYPTNWDSSDRIEVYIQGDPNGGTLWGIGDRYYDKAQQYAVGKGTSSGWSWATFGAGQAIPIGAGFEKAAVLDGSKIIYEIGATAFIWYGGRSGADTIDQSLVAGLEVGFDIVASTRYDVPDADFGMRSENLMIGKYADAQQFRTYTLFDDQCGRWGYFPADLDRNCEVDLGDFMIMAGDWMYCTEPTDSQCDTSWMP
jgi:hypothetical protein